MKINLLYFGRPGECLWISHEIADVPPEVATLADLLGWLHKRGPVWAYELAAPRVRCSINKSYAAWDAPIRKYDEVAIFSPIAGA